MNNFNKFPETPFCFNLKINPSCQTLSKTFEISKNIALTSRDGVASKDLCIVSTRSNNWLVVESPGRKPAWFLVIRLLEVR